MYKVINKNSVIFIDKKMSIMQDVYLTKAI